MACASMHRICRVAIEIVRLTPISHYRDVHTMCRPEERGTSAWWFAVAKDVITRCCSERHTTCNLQYEPPSCRVCPTGIPDSRPCCFGARAAKASHCAREIRMLNEGLLAT